MAFMKVNTETVQKTGDGASGIYSSGIFEVRINAVTLDVNENGARQIGLYVNYNDKDQMMYGAIDLDLYDGSKEIDGNVELFQRLMVVADAVDLGDGEEATLPIGKDGADKDVTIFPEFEDVELKIWVKQEFYKTKAGKIGDKRAIKDVFTLDNKSADEIVNDTEAGVKYGKREKYFEDIKYAKSVTKEEVDAWIDNGRKDEPSSGSRSSAPKPSFGKGGGFGK